MKIFSRIFCFSLHIQAEKDAEKDKKRPGSRGSAKSKSSKEREAEPQEPPPEEGMPPPERYWPVSIYLLYLIVSNFMLITSKCLKNSDRAKFQFGWYNVDIMLQLPWPCIRHIIINSKFIFACFHDFWWSIVPAMFAVYWLWRGE